MLCCVKPAWGGDGAAGEAAWAPARAPHPVIVPPTVTNTGCSAITAGTPVVSSNLGFGFYRSTAGQQLVPAGVA